MAAMFPAARCVPFAIAFALTLGGVVPLAAPRPPTLPAETLLDRTVLDALDQELSGVAAKDHVAHLALMHRVPASPGFHEAIEYVMGRARAFGLSDVHVETFPGDGETWFGTLHGNRGWRVDGGTLDEVQPRVRRVVSTDDVRLAVADNSESADVTAELIDVGSGSRATDYEGKDVRGKLVLCDATPGVCHRLAVEEHGAAGLVSYNANQPSAWWRDDQDLIRWGHLDARGRHNTFAIMISLREARSLQQRLAAGERITLRAIVHARNDDASPYETLVATIPGADPSAGDIVFSCHLDHEKPGANDNASGCSANLEIARTLKTLIDAKRIPRPVRTIRFIWPSEMTGTIAYLTKYPDIAARIRAAVHLDMVGGDPFITKSILHVTRSPWSIATVTDDVEEVFGRYVIDGAFRAAGEGDMTHAIRSQAGSKDAFWADVTPLRERERPLDLSGGCVCDPDGLSTRSSRHIHSHHARSAGQHRTDEDEAIGLHRRGQRLLSRDDARSGCVVDRAELRECAAAARRRRSSSGRHGGRPVRDAGSDEYRRARGAARAAEARIDIALRDAGGSAAHRATERSDCRNGEGPAALASSNAGGPARRRRRLPAAIVRSAGAGAQCHGEGSA